MQLFNLFLTVLSFLSITLAAPVSDEEWQKANNAPLAARAAEPEAVAATPVDDHHWPTAWPTPALPTYGWPTAWPTPSLPSWPTPSWPGLPTQSVHWKPKHTKRAVVGREALPTGLAPEIPADVLEV